MTSTGATHGRPRSRGRIWSFCSGPLKESQRRKPVNAVRRRTSCLWGRYARPDKVVRRLRRLFELNSEREGETPSLSC